MNDAPVNSPLTFKRRTAKEWDVVQQPTGATVVSCPSAEAAALTCAGLCGGSIEWDFTVLPPTDDVSEQILLSVQRLEKQQLVCRGQSHAMARSVTLARVGRFLHSEFTSAQWKAWGAFSSPTFDEQERLSFTLKLLHTAWLLTFDEDIWFAHPLNTTGVISRIPKTHLAAFFGERLGE